MVVITSKISWAFFEKALDQPKPKHVGNRNRRGETFNLFHPTLLPPELLDCQNFRCVVNCPQFRAVNAINVIVRDDEVLLADDVSGRSKPRSSKHKDTEKRGNSGEHEHNDRQPRPSAPADSEERARPAREGVGGTQAGEEEEFFHPVCCRECDHRVGVMDGDEVYHFFGVIASG